MQLAEALQDSETLEVSEDKEYVRRKDPLRPRHELIAELDKRTIYVRPFPFDVTMEQLEQFFRRYAPVTSVRLRRFQSKDFKGSVFVEFESEQSAQKASSFSLCP